MVLIAARHATPATCTPRDKQTWFFERNKGKRKTKQNYPVFEFKPRQVSDSLQSNQGTDHLVSHRANECRPLLWSNPERAMWALVEERPSGGEVATPRRQKGRSQACNLPARESRTWIKNRWKSVDFHKNRQNWFGPVLSAYKNR
jgi:hypothetical protein